VTEKVERPRLRIKRPPGTRDDAIEFRLLAGINAPDVLTGHDRDSRHGVLVRLFPAELRQAQRCRRANLLLVIAFTISNDLPRLGYLTFMDTSLLSAFVITSLVFLLAVY
jgi:hypothetical protein